MNLVNLSTNLLLAEMFDPFHCYNSLIIDSPADIFQHLLISILHSLTHLVTHGAHNACGG